MRSRWFHPPLLHTEHDQHKRVGWLELFYDLIFVAAAIQLGDALSYQISGTHAVLGPLLRFSGLFAVLFWAWSAFTFYANRFDVDDFTHRGLVFLNMLSIGVMAIVAPAAMKGKATDSFSLAFAFGALLITLLYGRAWYQEETAKEYSRFNTITFGLSTAVWLVSAFVPEPYRYGLWFVGMAVILVSNMLPRSVELYDRFPVDVEHLTERFGLLIIIVLGESFVKVLSYLSGSADPTDTVQVVGSLLPLLITFTIWWIYFDDIAGAPIRKRRGAETSWILFHMPLALGITALGVGLKKLVGMDYAAGAPQEYRWLIAAALGITFASVALIDSVTERRNVLLSDSLRVKVRLGSAGLVLLAAAVGDAMSAGAFVGLVTAVCLAQVVFDVMMAPFEESEADQLHHTGMEAVARMQSSTGAARGRASEMLAQTVRLNVPEHRRRDIYMFFIEGTWTQLITAAALGFALLNVVFAGLYMLRPDSISGPGPIDFSAAFAFSVQTITTIGYGGLTPGTSYGDFLVTVQSLCGVLGFALMTGIVFAKAARPSSGLLFSDKAVIADRNGVRTLMLRVGNAHGRDIVDARLQVAVVMDEVSAEGNHIARNHYLELVNDRLPFFSLVWMAMHEIDENSPLHGIPEDGIRERVRLAVATFTGHDSVNGAPVSDRVIIDGADILPGHRFVDTIGATADGRPVIDFARLNDTVAE